MIKRTLYFGNPAYLHLNNKQLVVRLPEVEKNELFSEDFTKEAKVMIQSFPKLKRRKRSGIDEWQTQINKIINYPNHDSVL